uniref:Ribosomal protein S11 n=1 Tax=Pterocladia lucida TaxID=31408 RepID=A0A6M3WWI2_PTELU|nr:ribosomal protein S11 [Pterocladia lucida]
MNKSKTIILKFCFTSTNILCSVTTIGSKSIFWTSTGSQKIKGMKKITSTTIIGILKKIIFKLHNLNFKYAHLRVKGFNRNKKAIIRYFKNSYIKILSINDETSFPHNGCKNKKVRRI